ncbi:MAG TPA: HDIG domain-containing protein [Prolixibacteraceae bacterium]|nr:HDIG domain-containing protein [Prolixibacteraceae bacterium]
MKTFQQKVTVWSRIIFSVAAFVIAALLLFFVLPSEPRFKYEYLKGAPWRHQNLVAPFDFAILKSDQEIEKERKILMDGFAPYFTIDTAVGQRKMQELKAKLEEIIPSAYTGKAQVIEVLTNELGKYYHLGILASSPQSIDILKGKTEISKVTGNTVKKVPVSLLYSEKTAFNAFSEKLKRNIDRFSGISSQLGVIDPAIYIISNLRFDELYNKNELKNMEAAIATATGMVQAGERIILQGEIVDEGRFQILESLKRSFEKRKGEGLNRQFVALGKGLLISVMLSLLFTYIFVYSNFQRDIRKIIFLLFFITLIVSLAMVINSYPGLHIYFFPLTILPVVIITFYDARTAIFTLIVTTLLIGFYAPNNYEYVLLELSAGMVAILSLKTMHRRGHVVIASVLVALTYGVLFMAVTLIQDGTLANFNIRMLRWFGWSSLLILLVYPLIYIFEKLFGLVSDLTLIELSNTNQPLLRKLAEEAPGTFQHSMQIASLAEDVVQKIGGNPFLVRAGALYHDIGKTVSPHFFIENQETGMANPHDQIPYIKSAEIIIDHVRKGIKTARKYKLPESIVEFIATHHGTGKAKYFYLKHQQENPGELSRDADFNYPGPLPHSREATIVMLIDGIEAASRSMKEKTYDNIKILIDTMIDQKIKDRQLDNSDLTFADIDKIREILLKKLVNLYHIRIEYPSEVKK